MPQGVLPELCRSNLVKGEKVEGKINGNKTWGLLNTSVEGRALC